MTTEQKTIYRCNLCQEPVTIEHPKKGYGLLCFEDRYAITSANKADIHLCEKCDDALANLYERALKARMMIPGALQKFLADPIFKEGLGD